MKRLSSIVCLFIIGCAVYAQDNTLAFKHQFTTKQSPSVTIDKITKYCEDILGFEVSGDNQEIIQGDLKNFHSERLKKEKKSFSASVKMTYRFEGNKVIFEVVVPSVSVRKIVCDRSQKETNDSPTTDEEWGTARWRLDSITDDIVEHFRDYVNRNKTENPIDFKVPEWMDFQYIVDDHSISYFKVLKSERDLSKEDLYKVAEDYFTYAYRSGKSVIQSRDPERCVIIGKGIYGDIHREGHSSLAYSETFSVPHILTLECRDGRVRATFSIQELDVERSGNKYVRADSFHVSALDYEPFGKNDEDGGVETIKKAESRIAAQFAEIQKAINEGNTSLETMDEW